jgi:hypothetical protein
VKSGDKSIIPDQLRASKDNGPPEKKTPCHAGGLQWQGAIPSSSRFPWNKIGFNGILISLLHFVFAARFIGKPFHTFPIAL